MYGLEVCLISGGVCCELAVFFFFQAEDGIRDLVRSRGLGDVYKRQERRLAIALPVRCEIHRWAQPNRWRAAARIRYTVTCLLYTSDAADERSSVDLGGRRIIKKKKKRQQSNDVHR